ncbi:MAG: endonuclease/exonuclease/phosphatase family protein [Pirellulales bacterium]
MRKFLLLVIGSAVACGGWYFSRHYTIEGLGGLTLSPKSGGVGETYGSNLPGVERDGNAIHVASFNIQVFGEKKLGDPRITHLLAEIVRRFDVVAIQEIRSTQTILPRFVDEINLTGRHYDYVIGPRLGRSSSKEQYAFVFDTASIEIDRAALYTVSDPDDLLHREPLVGWFRVRGPPADQAFTFTLVNIHTDPDETGRELDALADVFRAVRDDGRGEDDVILLGDLNVDEAHLGRLGRISAIHWAVSRVATNTRGTKQYDNIIFSELATTEYTGRWGVFDMIREFNLTVEEALAISDHQPVWAEFGLLEGGPRGRIATRPFNATSK